MMKGIKLRNIRMFRSQVTTWSADITGAPTALTNTVGANPIPFLPERIEMSQHDTQAGTLNGVVKLSGRRIRKDGATTKVPASAIYSSSDAGASVWMAMPAWVLGVIKEMREATA